MESYLKSYLHSIGSIIGLMQEDKSLSSSLSMLIRLIIETYENKGAVYFCGNGGSAADAQHLSAELSGRYLRDRKPLKSEALHVNSSFITAVANDYGYADIYARAIEAFGSSGDVLIALSTSGNSINVIEGVKKAKEMGITTACICGKNGQNLSSLCDISITIPSDQTPRIQECTLMIGHYICEIVESKLFP